jgi:signal transduction histidine kinase
LKHDAEVITRIRSTFLASRDAVQRAHERAGDVQLRAQRIREAMRQRVELHDSSEATSGELKRVEEESIRSARESQRFVAVVSHELRQPLNAAMGAMSLLDANPSVTAADRARVVLRRQLLHMSMLLDDLLDMSRLGLRKIRLERVPSDLRGILQEVIEAIEPSAHQADVILTCSLPSAQVPVVADAARLQQALSNLLTNAIRYTPAGGSVSASLSVQDSTALLNVDDTGRGIAAADLASIFEPFWRGRDSQGEGFGIGLALVRGIVELHDGSIAAFSDGPGKGARFCITLPVSPS